MFQSLKIIITSLFLTICFSLQAQIKDSVQQALQVKPKVVFGINSRFSQIAGNPSKTIKIFTGLDYDKKVRFELAYNYMPAASVDFIYPNKKDTIRRTNKLGYLGFQTEYTFYRKKNWKLSVPIQIGIGNNLRTEQKNQGTRVITRHTVFPLEGGANALYYFYDCDKSATQR